jgi:DNA mismatch repair ATPase MutS
MGKSRRRKSNSLQMPIIYPPEATKNNIETWKYCKSKYPERLIILCEGHFYFSLGDDALTISTTTRYNLDQERDEAICVFTKDQLTSVLEELSSLGISIAICDPPEDPAQHLFN